MAKETITLTELEVRILRDISFARMKVLNTESSYTPEDVTPDPALTVFTARQSLSLFDFFRCAWYGNTEGLKRISAGQEKINNHSETEFHDRIVEDYRKIMTDLMGTHYGPDDVEKLKVRIKEFIKSQRTPPGRTLYISDCHFFHKRLNTEMDRRGFDSVEDMNQHMIEQWNAKVTKNDTVYVLGDFSLAGGFETSGVLSSLNGKKHLIIGNHDGRYLKDKYFENHLLKSQQAYLEISDKKRKVILSHYPVFCYKGQYRRDAEGNPLTYMLYGHVHNTHDEKLINRFIMETRATRVMSRHSAEPEPIPCNMINCFCMFSDYQPMTLDEWIVIDRERREKEE